jgi:uncharacterized coiled-coil DUF342 family protein
MTQTLNTIASALAEKREIEAEISALQQRIDGLSGSLTEATERRRSLVEEELSAAGQRLLDGEDSAPPIRNV